MKFLAWLTDKPLTVALTIMCALLLYLIAYRPPVCQRTYTQELIFPVPPSHT